MHTQRNAAEEDELGHKWQTLLVYLQFEPLALEREEALLLVAVVGWVHRREISKRGTLCLYICACRTATNRLPGNDGSDVDIGTNVANQTAPFQVRFGQSLGQPCS
jgi:hypothetical protein